ncbi:MAG: hemerythrin family protein [Candidatus Accumulibacter sp. UW20]
MNPPALHDLEWTPALATGHAGIDDDHRAMVGLLNRLQAAGRRSAEGEIRAALAGLEAFTRDHFARQEQLMREIDDELAARHQREHVSLFDEICAQVDDMNEGLLSAAAIADFIRRWWLDHVETEDRRLSAALARRAAQRGNVDP